MIKDFAGLVKALIGFVNDLIPVLLGLALALFLWSGVQYIYKAGDAKSKTFNRQALVWGVVAMFLVFSLWGILRILCLSFFGSSRCY